MPLNGSGTYSAPALPGSWNPASSGSIASPTDWNTLLADMSTALSTMIAKDGQTTVTANLPMAGFRHTGVSNATTRDSYASAGQVQDGSTTYIAAGGTADAITLTLAPAITAYAIGQSFRFKALGANTVTNPTINVNGVGAGTIFWPDGSALAAGDIPANALVTVTCSATTPVWHLQTVSRLGYVAGVLPFFPPQGRLTLSTGVPVPIANTTGATSIYYTPYNGNLIPIYNGTTFIPTTFAELTNTTTDNTKSPAAVAANSNYDLFAWSDAGTIRLGRGPLWTSDTARGTGAGTTELQMLSGILTNKVAITNGPAANRGTYVGTVRSDGSSQLNWHVGAVAASGTAALLNVWNAYNRVTVQGLVGDTTDSWAYSTNTIRPANNSSTMRASFLQGLQEDAFSAEYAAQWTNDTTSRYGIAGIGYDSTTAFSGRYPKCTNSTVTAVNGHKVSVGSHRVQALGFHYMQALEYPEGTTHTWHGDNGGAAQSGLTYLGSF